LPSGSSKGIENGAGVVERFGEGALLVLRAHEGEVLGEADDSGAACGCFLDALANDSQVFGHVGLARELNGRDGEALHTHGARIYYLRGNFFPSASTMPEHHPSRCDRGDLGATARVPTP